MIRSKDSTLARRSFLQKCAASAFGVSLLPLMPQLTSASTVSEPGKIGFGKAKHVIFIFLGGGFPHIDTFDPKTGDSKGPGSPISSSAGSQFTDFVEKTAKVADKMTVIRSMHGDIGTHSEASYFMRTAYRPIATLRHPMIGAYAHKVLGPSHDVLPSSVVVGGGSQFGNGFLPSTMSPLPIMDPEAGLQHIEPHGKLAELQAKLAKLDKLNQPFRERYADASVEAYKSFYDDAIRLMGGRDGQAFNLTQESPTMREAYGHSKIGQGCLLARRLVESGVRFVEVRSGGWDMHKTLVPSMEEVCPPFDQAYSQLLTDLHRRGLLEDTLVVLTSEFGRTPAIKNGGRNHHPAAFSVALAGGGVKAGYTHGKTDSVGGTVEEDDVTYGDLHATIGWAMGIDHESDIVFSPSGRPIPIGNHGAKVVSEVFA